MLLDAFWGDKKKLSLRFEIRSFWKEGINLFLIRSPLLSPERSTAATPTSLLGSTTENRAFYSSFYFCIIPMYRRFEIAQCTRTVDARHTTSVAT